MQVSDEELEKRRESRISANTERNTTWAVGVWKDWAEERNVNAKSLGENVKQAAALSGGREDKL